ncbi:MAG TPA: NIL domain-containing protein [Thermodesulfobacteriota bacterium]|nr:NIL domain-containing protein [Thermodesulfobacteriota bacterium]
MKIARRIWLTYPPHLIEAPLLYRANRRFEVETSIRQASVTDQVGILALECRGEPEEIDRFIAFFREQGVRVDPVEQDVVAG